ncbi:MAG: quinolinate synthase NadA [Tidjanibacter sp.]|nr:quinolinate synthase NadA [Tidjanibacter sp.]
MEESNKNLKLKIEQLKKEKNCLILAHYYTRKEVQQIADFTGDSLALAQRAADNEADMILFAGVRFMAETAKVLSPDKKVLLPVMEASCSLADSCGAEELKRMKEQYPDHKVVSYVNTSVEVKALTDVCCTSSNALDVVGSFDKEQKIIFTPDANLGGFINNLTGRNMKLWKGACHVHDAVSVKSVEELKAEHPAAKVLVHPECRAEVVALADYAGSTKGIIDYAKNSDSEEFIIVTEPGVMYEIEREAPGKRFYSISRSNSCVECEYMKMVTLENIYEALLHEEPVVEIDEQVRCAAEKSIREMLKIK